MSRMQPVITENAHKTLVALGVESDSHSRLPAADYFCPGDLGHSERWKRSLLEALGRVDNVIAIRIFATAISRMESNSDALIDQWHRDFLAQMKSLKSAQGWERSTLAAYIAVEGLQHDDVPR